MSPDVRNADTVFAQAIEIASSEERDAFLEKALASDPEQRREVEKLVRDYFRAGEFLERPAARLVATADEPLSERPGTLIGPYKLMEQIGEGGMGLVFVAEQQQPVRRKVALKIIKPGMDSRQVIARFEAERQALALMDHPNIAKVLDAGTTESGRPYFVMEFVKGVSLTEYCDQNRLTTRQRLELFGSVCLAVQHAHQKGIIHRDLKPSNVLVAVHDVTPVVKVIDFGVAKATGQQLTEKTLYTAVAQMVGTPQYMSPEQAGLSALDVDTRGDIYSLGVLLYELLTGSTPFESETLRKAAYDEMRRIIREDEPPKPSTRLSTLEKGALSTLSERRGVDPRRLSSEVRGELDWMVMKALEKDRNRRYESASAFAADVQRFLNDEPVQACPPSASYRLRKFVRRHLALTAAYGLLALLSLFAVLGGSAGWLWQAAEKARGQAEKALQGEQKARAGEGEALRRQEALSYLHRVNLAQVAWSDNDLQRARLELDRCPMELRNWEWRYLHRLCYEEVLVLQGTRPTGGGHIIVFSLDGRRMASSSGGSTVTVWDLPSGREVMRKELEWTYVRCMAFSPDGKRIATGGGVQDQLTHKYIDNEIRVWDAAKGKVELTLKYDPYYVTELAFSPDGRKLASAHNSRVGNTDLDRSGEFFVRVWDLASGHEMHTLEAPTAVCNDLAFSPDGRRLTAVANGMLSSMRQRFALQSGPEQGQVEVKEWDLTTGRESLAVTLGEKGNTRLLAFSPYTQRLAIAGPDDIEIWDLVTQKHALTLKSKSPVAGLASFSPDGKCSGVQSRGQNSAGLRSSRRPGGLLSQGAHSARQGRSFQSQWQDLGERFWRWHVARVESDHCATAPHPDGTAGTVYPRSRLQPGRPAPGQRFWERHRPRQTGVWRGERLGSTDRSRSFSSRRTQAASHCRGLQPGWQAHGQYRGGRPIYWDLGLGHGPADSHPSKEAAAGHFLEPGLQPGRPERG